MENPKKKKKLSVFFVFNLRQELIEEILRRLPVKSLLRFKCVCKSWFSLISDPKFAISHFNLAASPSHRLLLRSTLFSIAKNRTIQSIPIDASFRDGSAVVDLFLPPPPPSSVPCYHNSPEDVAILGSCRGLVLLLYRTGDLVLWNPSIDVHRRITRSPYGIFYPSLTVNSYHCFRHDASADYYGFGYDASTDDYFVIFIILNSESRIRIEFFSLRTNSWDYIRSKPVSFNYESLGCGFMAGSLLNGALHWLVSSEDKMELVIIGFHLIERKLFEIRLPINFYLERRYVLCPPRLRVMGGCLALCYPGAVKGDEVEIWVMKEYKVPSTWTKSIVLSTCWYIPHKTFFPMCFTKDGGIFATRAHARFVKIDRKGQLLEDFIYRDHIGLDTQNLHSAMYTESLLSPPVECGEARLDA